MQSRLSSVLEIATGTAITLLIAYCLAAWTTNEVVAVTLALVVSTAVKYFLRRGYNFWSSK